MNFAQIVSAHFSEHRGVIELLSDSFSESISQSAKQIVQSLENGGTLFWCGNGGSAADSQHLAAELIGRFTKNRRALRSIALTTDTSVLAWYQMIGAMTVLSSG